jgi:two-component system, NarL family, response regulator DesR
MTIRVLVADDQAMIRSALAALIGLEDDMEVVGLPGTCAEAVAAVAALAPDVVLMDVQMPRGDGPDAPSDGIEATARILAAHPSVRVGVLTTFGRPGYLRRTLESGATGFMVKDAPADQLLDGIRRLARGLRAVDPELAAASLSIGPSPLSEKETEVLRAVDLGGSTADVAARVFLSEGTVRNHISNAIGKLGVANRTEALRVATENGWI